MELENNLPHKLNENQSQSAFFKSESLPTATNFFDSSNTSSSKTTQPYAYLSKADSDKIAEKYKLKLNGPVNKIVEQLKDLLLATAASADPIYSYVIVRSLETAVKDGHIDADNAVKIIDQLKKEKLLPPAVISNISAAMKITKNNIREYDPMGEMYTRLLRIWMLESKGSSDFIKLILSDTFGEVIRLIENRFYQLKIIEKIPDSQIKQKFIDDNFRELLAKCAKGYQQYVADQTHPIAMNLVPDDTRGPTQRFFLSLLENSSPKDDDKTFNVQFIAKVKEENGKSEVHEETELTPSTETVVSKEVKSSDYGHTLAFMNVRLFAEILRQFIQELSGYIGKDKYGLIVYPNNTLLDNLIPWLENYNLRILPWQIPIKSSKKPNTDAIDIPKSLRIETELTFREIYKTDLEKLLKEMQEKLNQDKQPITTLQNWLKDYELGKMDETTLFTRINQDFFVQHEISPKLTTRVLSKKGVFSAPKYKRLVDRLSVLMIEEQAVLDNIKAALEKETQLTYLDFEELTEQLSSLLEEEIINERKSSLKSPSKQSLLNTKDAVKKENGKHSNVQNLETILQELKQIKEKEALLIRENISNSLESIILKHEAIATNADELLQAIRAKLDAFYETAFQELKKQSPKIQIEGLTTDQSKQYLHDLLPKINQYYKNEIDINGLREQSFAIFLVANPKMENLKKQSEDLKAEAAKLKKESENLKKTEKSKEAEIKSQAAGELLLKATNLVKDAKESNNIHLEAYLRTINTKLDALFSNTFDDLKSQILKTAPKGSIAQEAIDAIKKKLTLLEKQKTGKGFASSLRDELANVLVSISTSHLTSSKNIFENIRKLLTSLTKNAISYLDFRKQFDRLLIICPDDDVAISLENQFNTLTTEQTPKYLELLKNLQNDNLDFLIQQYPKLKIIIDKLILYPKSPSSTFGILLQNSAKKIADEIFAQKLKGVLGHEAIRTFVAEFPAYLKSKKELKIVVKSLLKIDPSELKNLGNSELETHMRNFITRFGEQMKKIMPQPRLIKVVAALLTSLIAPSLQNGIKDDPKAAKKQLENFLNLPTKNLVPLIQKVINALKARNKIIKSFLEKTFKFVDEEYTNAHSDLIDAIQTFRVAKAKLSLTIHIEALKEHTKSLIKDNSKDAYFKTITQHEELILALIALQDNSDKVGLNKKRDKPDFKVALNKQIKTYRNVFEHILADPNLSQNHNSISSYILHQLHFSSLGNEDHKLLVDLSGRILQWVFGLTGTAVSNQLIENGYERKLLTDPTQDAILQRLLMRLGRTQKVEDHTGKLESYPEVEKKFITGILDFSTLDEKLKHEPTNIQNNSINSHRVFETFAPLLKGLSENYFLSDERLPRRAKLLFLAIDANHIPTIKNLVKDKDELSILLSYQQSRISEDTPLTYAIIKGRKDIFSLLINACNEAKLKNLVEMTIKYIFNLDIFNVEKYDAAHIRKNLLSNKSLMAMISTLKIVGQKVGAANIDKISKFSSDQKKSNSSEKEKSVASDESGPTFHKKNSPKIWSTLNDILSKESSIDKMKEIKSEKSAEVNAWFTTHLGAVFKADYKYDRERLFQMLNDLVKADPKNYTSLKTQADKATEVLNNWSILDSVLKKEAAPTKMNRLNFMYTTEITAWFTIQLNAVIQSVSKNNLERLNQMLLELRTINLAAYKSLNVLEAKANVTALSISNDDESTNVTTIKVKA